MKYRHLSALIKPVSGNCNMHCSYCFYRDVSAHREITDCGKMSLDTLEIIVRKMYELAENEVYFAFQGGEPTLIGLDFFRKFISLSKRYRPANMTVQYSLQTNAFSLDEEWAAFLAENQFFVGVSLDGTKDIHNQNRKTRSGKDTHGVIMKNLRLLEHEGVEYNILTVVTASVARHIESIYRFYKNHNFRYLQFIPCLDGLDEQRGLNPYSLTPSLYGKFLKKLFDFWFDDYIKGNHVYIRYFDNLLFAAAGLPVPACGMNGRCENQMVIEADGSVYPCDFYVIDSYKLGNIVTDELETVLHRGKKSDFVQEAVLSDTCKRCKWLTLCRGGCRRDRDYAGALGDNYFCSAFCDFFDYASERLYWLCRYKE